MSSFQPAGESKDLISPNQGHLRSNGLYLSSLTREYIIYMTFIWELPLILLLAVVRQYMLPGKGREDLETGYKQ